MIAYRDPNLDDIVTQKEVISCQSIKKSWGHSCVIFEKNVNIL